ncbi:alkaline phosphatase family protein [Actinomyces sp. 2119]|uniref:alkaline phosphatase family protein n=1 Tax=Actinomyces sp. 2119 TaxID=2321393 RepID=UPI0016021E46|nr:alkaline phosphatase family protein [Actinomyces sp. 2119]
MVPGAATPAGTQHAGLRQVLAAAAVGAGLVLADVGDPALGEAVLAHDQALRCARAWGLSEPRPTVLVLVDGLGAELLDQRRGHAPVLRQWSALTGSGTGAGLTTCRPTTTAAALTTLGTTALPGTTGMVGYCVLNPLLGGRLPEGTVPSADQLLSLVSWQGSALDPRSWQDVPTVFERLRREPGTAPGRTGLAASVGPARFVGSGLTEAALRGTTHLGADRLEERPGQAARALRSGTPLVYLYVGELDHTGHHHGWRSHQWLEQLERLDAALAELQRRVPPGTRLLLTADHGMVDTDAAHRLDLADHPDLARDVVAVAGEPRFTHLHLPHADGALAQEVAQRWRQRLGPRAAWVGTRQEAAVHLGPLGPRARDVTGDVVVAMGGTWVLVDSRVHSQAALAMRGVHGSLTRAETTVPLMTTVT